MSEKRFNRMCAQRRSLLHVEVTVSRSGPSTSATATNLDGVTEAGEGDDSLRRRSRPRRSRTKRRNTIAGTDQKEIQEAIAGGG